MIRWATARSGGLRVNRASGRREIVVTLLLGAAGAGLVVLATRQGWAQVRTLPPKPLPASQVTVTGSALVPYADALALAALATLAAVLATRGLARRLMGLLLAVIGAGVGAAAFTVTSAGAISAANASVGPATAGAGSVVDGGGSAPAAVPNVAGSAPHVTLAAGGWQALVILGALAMIGAGALVVWRAGRMAVMSARYDSPTASAGRLRPGIRSGRLPRSGAADSASIWEALSRGEDPTTVETGSQRPEYPVVG